MFLFENAGKKIRNWAFALFIIESIGALIGGIVTIASDDDQFFAGLLVIIGGIAAAFILSLFLSAFGELVESTTENKNINAKILEKLGEQKPVVVAGSAAAPQTASAAQTAPAQAAVQTTAYRPVAPNPEVWYCTSCGTENKKNYYQCKKCGKQRTSH